MMLNAKLGARAPAGASRRAQRVVPRASATTVTVAPPQVAEVAAQETATYYYQEPVTLDVDALHQRLEARAKAMILLEEQEAKLRTKVKFVLPMKVGLGECWKIVGKCPELGMFVPEVAPYMQWNNGDVWTLEVAVRPGKHAYKAVLKKPDGAYVWEEGKDRFLEFSQVNGLGGVKEVKLEKIVFPAS